MVIKPIINPITGTYAYKNLINISCETENVTIKYTLDGSDPDRNNGIEYTGPFLFDGENAIVKAVAYNDTEISSIDFSNIIYKVSGIISDIPNGTYNETGVLSLSSATSGCIIKFTVTTDGSEPLDPIVYGNEFHTPIIINNPKTRIKACGTRIGFINSDISEFEVLLKSSNPKITPESSQYILDESYEVNMSSATYGSTIRYTIDGTTPTKNTGIVYGGTPINLTESCVIKAISYAEGFYDSDVIEKTYEFKVKNPTLNYNNGSIFNNQATIIPSCITVGVYYKYTIDGSDPSDGNGTIVNNGDSITLDRTASIKIAAFKANKIMSDIIEYSYNFVVSNPILSENPGVKYNKNLITANCSTENSIIRYTMDGLPPTGSSPLFPVGGLTINNDEAVLSVKAFKNGYSDSRTKSINLEYVVSDITPNKSAGTYSEYPLQLSFSGTTVDETIYYTTDGTDPTDVNGTEYNEGDNISITETTEFKIVGYKDGFKKSNINTYQYVIANKKPIITPLTSNRNNDVTIRITSTDPTATIKYSIIYDENAYYSSDVPGSSLDNEYSGEFVVDKSCDIIAWAEKAGLASSEQALTTITLTCDLSFDKITGTYTEEQSVTLNSVTAGATIRYVDDGSALSEEFGTLYASPINIYNTGTEIKSLAYKNGYYSKNLSSVYTLKARNVSIETAEEVPFGDYANFSYGSIEFSNIPADRKIGFYFNENPDNLIVYVFSPDAPSLDINNPPEYTPRTGFIFGNEIIEVQNGDILNYVIYNKNSKIDITSTIDDIGAVYEMKNVSTEINNDYIFLGGKKLGSIIIYTTDGTDPECDMSGYPNISITNGHMYSYKNKINIVDGQTIKAIRYITGMESSDISSAAVNLVVSDPFFSDVDSIKNQKEDITIGCSTEGAEIRYTIDGTEPTDTSDLYTTAITPSENESAFTLKAKAFKNGFSNSNTVTLNLSYKVSDISVNLPDNGVYYNNKPSTITMNTDTIGAGIFYELNGDPEVEYTAPFSTPTDYTVEISVVGRKNGFIDSDTKVINVEYQVKEPVIPGIQEYYTSKHILDLRSETLLCNVWYKQGIETVFDSGTWTLWNGINLNMGDFGNPAEISIYLEREGYKSTDIITRSYEYKLREPIVLLEKYSSNLYKLTIKPYTNIEPGYIYYSIDNAIVDESSVGLNPGQSEIIYDNKPMVIRAKSIISGWESSNVVIKAVSLTGEEMVTEFDITPLGYMVDGTVIFNDFPTLTASVPGHVGDIYYTLDGSFPSRSDAVIPLEGIKFFKNSVITLAALKTLGETPVSEITINYGNTDPTDDELEITTEPTPIGMELKVGGEINIDTPITNLEFNTNGWESVIYTIDGSEPVFGNANTYFYSPFEHFREYNTFANINSSCVLKFKGLVGYDPEPENNENISTKVVKTYIQPEGPDIRVVNNSWKDENGILRTSEVIIGSDNARIEITHDNPEMSNYLYYTTAVGAAEVTDSDNHYNGEFELLGKQYGAVKVLSKAIYPDVPNGGTAAKWFVLKGVKVAPNIPQNSEGTPFFENKNVKLNLDPSTPWTVDDESFLGTNDWKEVFEVRYTLDGTIPNKESQLYDDNEGINIERISTLKLKTYYKNMETGIPGEVTSFTYWFKTLNPVCDIEDGVYEEKQTLQFFGDGSVFYTTNGVEPEILLDYNYNASRPLEDGVYEGKYFFAEVTSTIKFKAKKEGWLPSDSVTSNIELKMPNPEVVPAGGTKQEDVFIGFDNFPEDIIDDVKVYYTIDGSDPKTNGIEWELQYIKLERETTLKFYSTKTGWTDSDVLQEEYDFLCKTPFLTNTENKYSEETVFVINTGTPGSSTNHVKIYYTLDGTEPTDTSDFLESDNDTVTFTTDQPFSLKMYATRDGWENSSASTVRVVGFKCKEPSINIVQAANGSYDVDISYEAGYNVKYTTDGSEPDENNGKFFIGTINISSNCTLKAIAIKNGWDISDVVTEEFNFKLPAPVINIESGTYNEDKTVEIIGGGFGESIYYTTNMYNPDDYGILYSGPIEIDASCTIRAISKQAFKENSDEAESKTITLKNKPISITGSNVKYDKFFIEIISENVNSGIKYTLNGDNPSGNTAIVMDKEIGVLIDGDTKRKFTIPYEINVTNTRLGAIAFKNGWENSEKLDVTFTLKTNMPYVDILGGEYISPFDIIIKSDYGDNVKYSLDGTENWVGPFVGETPSIRIDKTCTLKFLASKNGFEDSEVTTEEYIFISQKPTIDTLEGEINGKGEVVVSSPNGTMQYRYTVDGTIPDENSKTSFSPIKLEPKNNSGEVDLIVRSYKPGWKLSDPSDVKSFVLKCSPATPTAPEGISYETINIGFLSETEGVIRYTVDGSDPDVNSDIFSGVIKLSEGQETTIKTIVMKEKWLNSEISTRNFKVTGKVSRVNSSLLSGTYAGDKRVKLTCAYPNAEIRYTVDGTEPTETSNLYTSELTISVGTTTLKAKAFIVDYIPSDTYNFEYTINGPVENPVVSPVSGKYKTSQVFEASCTDVGATIKYRMNGSDWRSYVSPIFLSLDNKYKIDVKAIKSGHVDSDTIVCEYDMTGFLEEPVPDKAPGQFPYKTSIKFINIKPGSNIYYTIDGTIPTDTSIVYDKINGIIIDENTVVEISAIAILDGWENSEVFQGIYSVNSNLDAPVMLLDDIPYYTEDKILTFQDDGNDIYFTVDGSTPSKNNGTLYSSPVVITENTTVKAIAVKENWGNSPIATKFYKFKLSSPISDTAEGVYTSNIVVGLAGVGVIKYSINDTNIENIYNSPLLIDRSCVLRFKSSGIIGKFDSDVVTQDFTITGKTGNVIFTKSSGLYKEPVSFKMNTPTSGSVIKYSTDGTDIINANDGIIYKGEYITVENDSELNIKAKAFKNNYEASEQTELNIVVTGKVNAPEFDMVTFLFEEEATVAIKHDIGTYVKYTTDGTIPSNTNGLIYSGEFYFYNSARIYARAFKTNYEPSSIIYCDLSVLDTSIYNIPKNLTLEENVLTWETNVNADSYNVYFSTEDSFTLYKSGITNLHAEIEFLNKIGKNRFCVTSVIAGSESGFSNIVEKTLNQKGYKIGAPSIAPGTYCDNLTVFLNTSPEAFVQYIVDDGSEVFYNGSGIILDKNIFDGEMVKEGTCRERSIIVKVYDLNWNVITKKTYLYTLYNVDNGSNPVHRAIKTAVEFLNEKDSNLKKISSLKYVIEQLKDELEYYVSEFRGEKDLILQYAKTLYNSGITVEEKEKIEQIISKYKVMDIPYLVRMYSENGVLSGMLKSINNINDYLNVIKKEREHADFTLKQMFKNFFLDLSLNNKSKKYFSGEYSTEIKVKTELKNELIPNEKIIVTIFNGSDYSNEDIKRYVKQGNLVGNLILVYENSIMNETKITNELIEIPYGKTLIIRDVVKI